MSLWYYDQGEKSKPMVVRTAEKNAVLSEEEVAAYEAVLEVLHSRVQAVFCFRCQTKTSAYIWISAPYLTKAHYWRWR